MAQRYCLLDIFTVVLLVFIKDCKGDIQSFTNFGNGWVSSGYHASFESDSDPQMDLNQMELSGFKSPLNPFSSSDQSGFSSNSYSSSYLESSRFPSEDVMNTMFNSDASEPRSNVHVFSSSSWPWNQDYSSASFDSAKESFERNSQSIVDKMKNYISSSADKLGFNNGNSNMKTSEINTYKKMSDALEELKLHGFDTDLPFFTSAHTGITSKLNNPASPEIFSKSRTTSFRMQSSSSTPAPSPRVLPTSNAASKPQHTEIKRYRPKYNKNLTTKRPRFEKKSSENSSVNIKYPSKYFANSDSNLNSKASARIPFSNRTLSKLQPAIKDDNCSLLSLGKTYDHTEYSLSSGLIISPKNKKNALSSDSLISSEYKNPESRIQVQNRSDSSRNAPKNLNIKPLYPSISSSNQTKYLNLAGNSNNTKYKSGQIISPKNQNNALSSAPLISSKYKNPESRIQVQNRTDSTRNASKNVNIKPLYPSISSTNQTMSLNLTDNSNSHQNRTNGKLTNDFYTSSNYVYVKEYQNSDSQFKYLLVGLIRYNTARSRRHYNKHFYNDEFYRNRVSLPSNTYQVNNSVTEIATCTLNIKEKEEKDQVILLKIPCEIVSTFTDGSHRIEATNITKTTTCVTNTTILNNEVSKLKEKLVTNSTEVPILTVTENLLNKTTIVSTIDTRRNLTHILTDLTTSPKPKTSDKFFKSTITNTILKIATTPKSPVDDITMNSTVKSNSTITSSKLGVSYVQDMKITSFHHQGLKLVTVTTCTTEVTDPLSIKGPPINTSNIQCNVEIHTQETFLRNSVNCKTLLRYAKLYKP